MILFSNVFKLVSFTLINNYYSTSQTCYFRIMIKLLAYEILGNPKKRLGYDSVDPTFNDTIPKQSAANSGDQFYQLFSAAFESNAR